jgi:chloramphenicol-sensitive protein RarD
MLFTGVSNEFVCEACMHAGVMYSLVGSVLFAVMYYYATLLSPLNGEQIYGWRIIFTALFLTMMMVVSGKRQEIAVIWQRVLARPILLLALLASSFLVGVQLWLFMWAPVSGYGLDVSLGYFLLPLTLVVTGRCFFNERITRWQTIACILAVVGIANELLFAPRVSWPAFVVALGYPLYFSLRRLLQTNHLGGLWFDLMLSLPVAIWLMADAVPVEVQTKPLFTLSMLILGLGLLSATALACMVNASRRLQLGLFGLLSYVEPALLVVVALLLGERIAQEQWLTYISIWIAIGILTAEGVANLRAKRSP